MDFSKIKNLAIPEGSVKSISIGGNVVWKKPEYPIQKKRFRFKNVSPVVGTIKMEKVDQNNVSAPEIVLERSYNGIDYYPCNIYNGIQIYPNETIYLRGTNTTNAVKSGDVSYIYFSYNKFVLDTNMESAGSIMDIFDNGTDTTILTQPGQAAYLFNRCSTLTQAPELPATTLTDYCYNFMFQGCTSLQTAPKLPATTLADSCYTGMFSSCTSLVQAPELPATTLAPECYEWMFGRCTSLTQAPELPATELADICYYQMFYGCTSLQTAPKLPATTLADRCYLGMFYGCTSLAAAPYLPAKTDILNAYGYMFYGCESLNYISVGATTWTSPISWVAGVSPSGTFVKPVELVAWDGTGTRPEGSIPLNNDRGIPTGWVVKKPEIKPRTNAFRFKNVSGAPNTVKLVKEGEAPIVTLEKSSDGISYEPFDCYTGVELQPDETVYLRGDNPTMATGYANYNHFTSTNSIECHGSIMDLCDGGTDTTECKNNLQFSELFRGCKVLKTTPELPAEILTDNCYYGLFEDCSSLVSAPVLPATILKTYCYRRMFAYCTSLTQTPDLPAETLANGCYECMFEYCKKLVIAPELPATTLADSCYDNMFAYCDLLTQVPNILPATILFSSCYRGMFRYCISLVKTPELSATTLAQNCYQQMFEGCKRVNQIILRATAWDKFRFSYWLDGVASTGNIDAPNLTFDDLPESTSGCPKGWTLNGQERPVPEDHRFRFYNPGDTVNTLSATGNPSFETSTDGKTWTPDAAFTSAEIQPKSTLYLRGKNTTMQNKTFKSTQPIECHGSVMDLCDGGTGTLACTVDYQFLNLFSLSKNLTTPPELPATKLTHGCYQQMFNQCISLTQAPKFPATTLADHCYNYMFNGCTSLTTASKLPATTLADSCYSYMFYKCTSLTQAPELPATTLAKNCYSGMFSNCSSLTQAPKLPATTLAEGCYNGMFKVCSSLTQAPDLPVTTLAGWCYQYMFQNCTSLTKAPELPAATLVDSCYQYMFQNCSKINYVKVLATSWNTGFTENWLYGASATGNIDAPHLVFGFLPANVSGCPERWTLNGQERPKPSINDRFRFKNVSDTPNTIKLVKGDYSAPYITLEKSSDGVNYEKGFSMYGEGVTLQPGETVYLRGNNKTFTTSYSDFNSFTSTGNVECHGNIMDLCDGASDTVVCTEGYQFRKVFRNMTTLLTAPKINALVFSPTCFYNLFEGCTNLKYIEVSTTKWSGCFWNWVSGVPAGGTFVKPASLQIGTGEGQIPENDISGIPTGWTVENV